MHAETDRQIKFSIKIPEGKGLSRLAFTLAEVLITLGIIGVVAAMTIPTLINKTNDLELKSAWKKEYSTFSQAFTQIVNDNGGSVMGVFATNTGGEALKDAFKSKLLVTKNCIGDSSQGGTGSGSAISGCWHPMSGYKYLNGTVSTDNMLYPGLILNDGAFVVFASSSSTCTDATITGADFTRCGWLTVDVNGFKGPNVTGKDIFGMAITPTELIPNGARGGYDPTIYCVPGSTDANNTGRGCPAKYLYE